MSIFIGIKPGFSAACTNVEPRPTSDMSFVITRTYSYIHRLLFLRSSRGLGLSTSRQLPEAAHVTLLDFSLRWTNHQYPIGRLLGSSLWDSVQPERLLQPHCWDCTGEVAFRITSKKTACQSQPPQPPRIVEFSHTPGFAAVLIRVTSTPSRRTLQLVRCQ